MIGSWLWELVLARIFAGGRRVVTDEELEMSRSFKEWLELDVVEREKRKAAMTDEEREKLKATEVAYYNQKDGF